MKFYLSYSCPDARGYKDDPSWANIDWAISHAFSQSSNGVGYVGLDFFGGAFSKLELNLEVEHRHCLVTGFYDVSEFESQVVALDNPNWEQDQIEIAYYSDNKHPMVDIHGNYWDATSVTTNVNFVKDVFKQFYETGTYSHPQLFLV